MAAGLKTHIWNNNLRSVMLIAFYPFIVGALVWIISFAASYFLNYGAHGQEVTTNHSIDNAYHVLTNYWPAIFTVIGIWFVTAYFFQTKMVRALSHSHPVSRKEEPELYNLLENLSITAGIPMPRLEIIETHARNAFASGVDKNSYTVTVTRGLMQSLSTDEMEGVLAHEVTHILNRDVRLLIVSIIFTGMIGFAAQMVWSMIRYSSFSRSRDSGKTVIILLVIALILWIGYLATMFTRFALSRSREFMADAGAIELTKNPDAMMRALLRISGKAQIPKAAGDINLMCIENKVPFMGLFMTHPPIEKRLKALSEYTATPIPEINAGTRTDDENRFSAPDHENPPSWATLAAKQKHGDKKNPWK
jgi:heat shock protein HtpX